MRRNNFELTSTRTRGIYSNIQIKHVQTPIEMEILTKSCSTEKKMSWIIEKGAYNSVEESGLADVGETNNAGSEAHAYLGGREAAVE